MKLIELKKELASSFEKAGMHHRADWWYRYVEEVLEHFEGPDDNETLNNDIRHGLFNLNRESWLQADVYLLRAQEKASAMLNVDDPLRKRIADCLRDRVWVPGSKSYGIH